MNEEKPTVDDLLYRPQPILRRKYGQFGEDVAPAVQTHDRIVAVLATMDQRGTDEMYDPEAELWEELQRVKTLIRNDLRGKIKDEFDD